jgi:hypothetical protein
MLVLKKTVTMESIDDILNSEEFKLIHDSQQEKKELKKIGWTYKMIDQVVKFILNNKNDNSYGIF